MKVAPFIRMKIEREPFGSVLREARERRGISLHDLASFTNVAPELWRDFERSDLSYWPDHLDAVSCVRQYAELVGLNPDNVVDQFCRLYPEQHDRVEPLLRAHPALVHELD